MGFEDLKQSDIVDMIKNDKIEEIPFLQKIDMSFIDRGAGVDGIDYYRVLDGIPDVISGQLYDDLIPNNFNEEEREEKADFQAFFDKDPKLDARRENLNIVAVSNGKFVGLLTGMAFHKSKVGYFDYVVVDEAVRSKGIGGKLFQAGKRLMKGVAQQHGYDHPDLAVLLTVEKPDSVMNLDKGQDPRKRLSFYDRQNCQRVGGMPCYLPGIVDSETGEQKQPMDCFDWLITGVNRNFQNGEIVMDRSTALQFNADNLDLEYTDPMERDAEETETYKMIEQTLGNEIYAEDLFTKEKVSHLTIHQNKNIEQGMEQ